MNEPLHYRCTNCRHGVGEVAPEKCPVCGVRKFERYAPWVARFSLLRLMLAPVVVGAYIALFRPGPHTPIDANPLGWPLYAVSSSSPGDWLCALVVAGPLMIAMLSFVLFPRPLTGLIAATAAGFWCLIGWMLATAAAA